MQTTVKRFALALVTLSVSTASTAQPATQSRASGLGRVVRPNAVQQAQQTLEQAAAARNIKLTDAAKQALAKEAIHSEVAAPGSTATPISGALSPEKVNDLLAPLADAGSTRLTERDVHARIADQKVKQVVATLPTDIPTRTSVGAPLPDEVRARILTDLSSQSAVLSKNGLPVEAIRARNLATVHALDQALQNTSAITVPVYQQAMRDIFPKHVTLDITTTPAGAAVTANGQGIGLTDIHAKQFLPDPITFRFTLAGYQPAELAYVATPGTDTDTVSEQLIKTAEAAAPDGSTSTPEPASKATAPAASPSWSLSGSAWTYAALIGVIAVLVILLISRKR